jgi:hypothetical protein
MTTIVILIVVGLVIEDLYANLCHKIKFDRFRASFIADSLDNHFRLKEPLIDDAIFQEELELSKHQYINYREFFERDASEYISLRNKSISLLIKHNINADNLAFGNFFDMTKDLYNGLFKNEI